MPRSVILVALLAGCTGRAVHVPSAPVDPRDSALPNSRPSPTTKEPAPKSVRVLAQQWFPNLQGKMTINGDPFFLLPFYGTQPEDGTPVTFEGDLGLDDRGSITVLGLDIATGQAEWATPADTRISLSYFSNTWKGRATLAEDEVVEGATFAAGSSVESSVQFDYYAFDWVWTPQPKDQSTLLWDLKAGLRYAGPRFEMESASESEEMNLMGILIGGGFGGQWRAERWLEFSGSVGASFGVGGHSSVNMIEAGFEVAGVLGSSRASIGYRYLRCDLHASEEDFEQADGRAILGGLSLAVEVRF